MVAARAPARFAAKSPRRPLRLADRAHRRRQDPCRFPADLGGAFVSCASFLLLSLCPCGGETRSSRFFSLPPWGGGAGRGVSIRTALDDTPLPAACGWRPPPQGGR